jgi:hypothetical protein
MHKLENKIEMKVKILCNKPLCSLVFRMSDDEQSINQVGLNVRHHR